MEFAHVSRPKRGEAHCGDAVGVFGSNGTRLFAVTDGLGHGPEAQHASEKALSVISGLWQSDMESIIWSCHERLRDTRGLALFLCRYTEGAEGLLECAGVGNVECKVFGREGIAPFPRDGIVGHRLRKVTPFQYPCDPGLTVAVYTDGIHGSFNLSEFGGLEPGTAVEAILGRFGKDYDDATVLVVRT
jgi:phosphoserine phosphatase RsbX